MYVTTLLYLLHDGGGLDFANVYWYNCTAQLTPCSMPTLNLALLTLDLKNVSLQLKN